MTRTFDADYYDDLLTHLAENVNDRAENLEYSAALWRSTRNFIPRLDQQVAERILDLSWTDPRDDHLEALEAEHDSGTRMRWRAFSVLIQDVDEYT
jgi:hypothetical protein